VRTPAVIFIGGYSRSGSTLLARMLDAVPGVVSVGELRHLWVRGLGENRLCSCGTPFRSCPRWNEVLAAAFGGSVPADRAVDLQRRVDRAFLAPRIAAGGRGSWADDLAEYRSYLGAILAAVAGVTGCGVVVDASKDPSHGYVLGGIEGVDPVAVHLVRDPRAVAHSWRRSKHDPATGRPMPRQAVVRSAAEWTTANALALDLGRRMRPSLTLRYESLVADPATAVDDVLALAGLGGTPLPFLSGRTVTLGGGHAFSGNPDLFTRGDVAIRPDDGWRTGMPTRDRVVVAALTRPVDVLVTRRSSRPPR